MWRVLPLALLLLAPMGVAAQNEDPANIVDDLADDTLPDVEDLADLSFEDLMAFDMNTVYAASRHDQSVRDAPASVTIITSEEIARHGYQTLAQILESIRGLYVTSDRNYDYFGVRGFGLPADDNTRLLLLIDGHRMNDSVFGAALIGTDGVLDVALIDKVEFVRGPSSSLYGDGAFFGVINIITKSAEDLDGTELSTGVGSFSSYRGRSTFAKTLENGLSMVLSASVYDSEGQDLEFPEFDDPATNNGVAEGVDGDQSLTLLSQFTYENIRLQSIYSYHDKTVPTGSYGTVFGSDESRTVDERFYVDLRLEHEVTEQTDLMAHVFFDRYKFRGDYHYDYAVAPPPDLVLNQDTGVGESVGIELQATTEFEWGTATYGAEYRDYYRQDQSNSDRSPHFDYFASTEDDGVAAAYTQLDVPVGEQVRVNAGARFDYYDSFGETLNPRAALIYQPLEKTTVKLLFGRAFRAPSAFEFYYHDGNTTQKANPHLDPETILTYELVLEQTFFEHHKLVLSAFHYDAEDLIIQVLDPTDGLVVFRNADEVESNGAEAELQSILPNGLLSRLSYAYQRTELDSVGRSLRNSPEHLAKANISMPLQKDKLFAGLELQYTSRRKTVSGNHADEALLTNVSLEVRDVVEGFDFTATVRNLFDVSYDDPGALEHVQDVITQDGVSFWLQVSYRF